MVLDLTLVLSATLIVLVLVLVLVVRHHRDAVGKLREELDWAAAERRRLQQRRDAWGAQWAPLLSGYPYDPRHFRFLGSPVEGVQFNEDRIVFVSLGFAPRADAERVRDLVRAGRVEFHEAPLTPAAPAPGDAAPAPP